MTPERFIVRAYVCGKSCVRWRHDEGSMTFVQVYVQRPRDCRYAIVETAQSEVLAIDLYNAHTIDNTLWVGDYKAYPTVDAAVMATALNYE